LAHDDLDAEVALQLAQARVLLAEQAHRLLRVVQLDLLGHHEEFSRSVSARPRRSPSARQASFSAVAPADLSFSDQRRWKSRRRQVPVSRPASHVASSQRRAREILSAPPWASASSKRAKSSSSRCADHGSSGPAIPRSRAERSSSSRASSSRPPRRAAMTDAVQAFRKAARSGARPLSGVSALTSSARSSASTASRPKAAGPKRASSFSRKWSSPSARNSAPSAAAST